MGLGFDERLIIWRFQDYIQSKKLRISQFPPLFLHNFPTFLFNFKDPTSNLLLLFVPIFRPDFYTGSLMNCRFFRRLWVLLLIVLTFWNFLGASRSSGDSEFSVLNQYGDSSEGLARIGGRSLLSLPL